MVNLEPKDKEVKESNWVERRMRLGAIGTIFASGSAMFSDGYANAGIGPAGYIIRNYVYKPLFAANPSLTSLLSALGFAGQVLGQLSFGYISDKIGRKFSMLVCTSIIFVFSALSAAAKGPGADGRGTVNALIAYRFLLGIGIGGEYPSGSVAAAENTEDPAVKKSSQQKLFVLATNTMLDFAFAIAYFVTLVCCWIWVPGGHYNAIWRVSLGLGVVPPIFLMYFRIKMREPETYRLSSMKRTRIPYWLIIKRYWVKLLAVCITWFIYDWITYPFGIYASTITDIADPDSTIYSDIGWGCLINAFYIPGTLVGALIVDYLGPKYCMIFGLLMQALFGFVLSGCFNALVPNHIAGFAVMYGLFLAFGEVGPGNNLGLLASKAIGPTAARGQMYGIAAAIGKVGAFIGTYTFTYIQADMEAKSKYLGDTGLFWIGSSLAVFSALVTFFFIPDIRVDYMHDEDIRFRAYLEEHGYDTTNMGLQDNVTDREAQAISEAVDEHKGEDHVASVVQRGPQ